MPSFLWGTSQMASDTISTPYFWKSRYCLCLLCLYAFTDFPPLKYHPALIWLLMLAIQRTEVSDCQIPNNSLLLETTPSLFSKFFQPFDNLIPSLSEYLSNEADFNAGSGHPLSLLAFDATRCCRQNICNMPTIHFNIQFHPTECQAFLKNAVA